MAQVPRPLLEVVASGKVTARHEIPPDHELVIGRTDQCAVVIGHSSVSRMHAKVWTDAAGVYVDDLGSANGTFVEGKRLTGPARLSHGQSIQIGQRAVEDPILLRFEDPATRLLQEMGLFAPPPQANSTENPLPPPPGTRRPAGNVPPTAPVRDLPVPSTSPVALGAVASSGTTTASASPIPEVSPAVSIAEPVVGMAATARPLWRNPLVLLTAFAGLAVFVLITAQLVQRFRPAATVWRSVELLPAQVGPGERLALISDDIKPDAVLTVSLAGQQIADVTRRAGRIEVEIPTLAEHGAGVHDLPLVVAENSLAVFSGSLRYVVQPRITGFDPLLVPVGRIAAVLGSGFAGQTGDVQAWIGDLPATVSSTAATRVELVVPNLLSQGFGEFDVRLVMGGLEAKSPKRLRVLPRVPEPLVPHFVAEFRPGQDGFAVSSELGTMFLLSGRDEPRARARVEALTARFAEALNSAASDPDLRISTRNRSGRLVLEATSPNQSEPIVLFEWSDDELASAIPTSGETTPELVASWLAGGFSQLLEVFGRGVAPTATRGSPPGVAALAKLVELNVENGGNGKPEASDLAGLRPAERQAIASSWMMLPSGFGSLSGSWSGTLQNVFDPEGGGEVALELQLRQRGRAISGTGTVRFRSTGMEIALPTSAVNGSPIAGSPTRVRLTLVTGKPVGQLVLIGDLTGEELSGTFQATQGGNRRDGTWQALRLAGR